MGRRRKKETQAFHDEMAYDMLGEHVRLVIDVASSVGSITRSVVPQYYVLGSWA